MIRIIKADGHTELDYLNILKKRSEENNNKAAAAVNDIIENVKKNGDTALSEYTKRFDGVEIDSFEISRDIIKSARDNIDPTLLKVMESSAANIKDFHERQKRQSWFNAKKNGVMLGQRIRGLDKVGLYVPGGTAAYPSSVLMNAIPAKIAGVKEIIMVTPPSKDGKLNYNILAAADIAGVDRVFSVGGAHAIAALAYGTESIPKVDKIVGPGNIFVATAKKLLYGTTDIDMIAGPSEILVLADETAEPKLLAADLMSQAEHDVLASSILVCTSEKTAEETDMEIQRQIKELERKDIIECSIKDYGIAIVCDSVDYAVELANRIAPEHLEVMMENPFEYLGRLDNAGSVFLGKYAPEPLGDYYAGPNHVLPTSGTARFFSPLSVESFIKASSFIYYPEKELGRVKDDIMLFAKTEGLTAHANSIKVRF